MHDKHNKEVVILVVYVPTFDHHDGVSVVVQIWFLKPQIWIP